MVNWSKLVGKVIKTSICPGEKVFVEDYNTKTGELVLKSEHFAKTSSMGAYRVIPASVARTLKLLA